jgi:hypothetical protein
MTSGIQAGGRWVLLVLSSGDLRIDRHYVRLNRHFDSTQSERTRYFPTVDYTNPHTQKETKRPVLLFWRRFGMWLARNLENCIQKASVLIQRGFIVRGNGGAYRFRGRRCDDLQPANKNP